MSDQTWSVLPQISRDSPSRTTVKFVTSSTIGAAFLILAGLTLTGTVLALVVATPVMVIFSPILVPSVIVLFVVTTGFIFSGAFGLAAVTALYWMYNYITGKHPPGADKLDYARGQIARKAHDMKERAKEYRQYVQQKAQEATQTTTQASS